MNVFQRLLQILGFTGSDRQAGSEPTIEEYPNNNDIEFKTHIELVAKHFSFLTNELGFQLSRSRMDGHEHTTIFTRNHLSVHIIFAWGSLPLIYIKNNLLPYDESKGLDNGELVQDYSEEMKKIMKIHSERVKPAYNFFYKNNYDDKYLQEDYKNFGQEDYIRYMSLAGTTGRDMLINQKGMIKDVLMPDKIKV
jgi:hypothetical protein